MREMGGGTGISWLLWHLAVVARAHGGGRHLDQAAVHVTRLPCADALTHDATAKVEWWGVRSRWGVRSKWGSGDHSV
jgi:hypothetical protein